MHVGYLFFFFKCTATTEIYTYCPTLSLHDALPICLEAATGTEQWMVDRTVPSLTLRGLSAPVVVGNRVYVGLDNGRVLALRTSDGQVAWEQVVSAPTGRNELERITDIDAPLLSDGGELFAASFGGELACLDDETGQILWRHALKS